MEQLGSENLMIFLLAAFSGWNLFQHGLNQVHATCDKTELED